MQPGSWSGVSSRRVESQAKLIIRRSLAFVADGISRTESWVSRPPCGVHRDPQVAFVLQHLALHDLRGRMPRRRVGYRVAHVGGKLHDQPEIVFPKPRRFRLVDLANRCCRSSRSAAQYPSSTVPIRADIAAARLGCSAAEQP